MRRIIILATIALLMLAVPASVMAERFTFFVHSLNKFRGHWAVSPVDVEDHEYHSFDCFDLEEYPGYA